MTIGSRGFGSSQAVGLERNPVTGVLYAVLNSVLYVINPQTGQATQVAQIAGTLTNEGLANIAIDSSGVAISIGARVYRMDLSSGVATALGVLPSLSGAGWFFDLAFSSNGDLWGSYYSVVSTSMHGLYKIDLNTMGSTQVINTPAFGYWGIAFGPAMQMTNYCTAKTNSLGCVPTISASGLASPTANSGFTISAGQVRSQSVGTLIYGVNGRAALPFGGGLTCVVAPWRRTNVISSGGPGAPLNDCMGVWSIDFNAWMSTHVALPPGTTIQSQWHGRDGGFAPPNAWSLTDALEFVLQP